MKKIFPFLVFSFLFSNFSFSQDISADTTLANEYYTIASVFLGEWQLDSVVFYSGKASELYVKHLGEKSLKNAKCLNLIGIVYDNKSEYEKALEYYFKSLEIRLELLGEKHIDIANSYNNIGIVYWEKLEHKLSLEYYLKSLEIKLEQFGEKSIEVATSYINIGSLYFDISEYDKALEYYQKSLEIRLELLGEKHTKVANSYNNIGSVYNSKSEFDNALEYYFKSLEIKLELLGEKSIEVATTYNDIGTVYFDKSEYDKSLEYFLKSLEIRLELLGEKHANVAGSYNNIGTVYLYKSEYDKSLEYYLKSLEIILELHGKKRINVAYTYNNIGEVYFDKSEYNKALEYYFKSLEILKEAFGEKHTLVATSYNNIGAVYLYKKEYNKALLYFQKGVASCLYNFNDTVNVSAVSEIKDYLDWNELLEGLQLKAEIFSDTAIVQTLHATSVHGAQEIALKHYQACDTLITKVRKEITTQSDKIALGEKASEVYKAAANLSYELGKKNDELNITVKSTHNSTFYAQHYNAFYFSERNKSSVLLEALAGSDALKFAGIPQELLDKEHDLSIDIASYTNLKNNAENDSIANIRSSHLFNLNRTYDSLIVAFETNYPEYYQLKYNNSPVTVEQIQSVLDKKTTMLSYFMLDSSVVIYCISKKGFEIYKTDFKQDFSENIEKFTIAIQSNKKASVLQYKDLAFEFFKQLFPSELQKLLAKTENLIIIPDGALSTIPFESLLTEDYTKDFTSWTDKTYFSEMPFLIKKYAISYSYSATLFYNTFPKVNSKEVEFKDLNDFIAFAPVFDEEGIAGTTELSQKLLADLDENMKDSTITTRGFLKDGRYVNPLPGSLKEV